MAALVIKVLFWSIFAAIVACVEIESEGKHGWAEKMPTWYRTTGFWGRTYMMLTGWPLTGYHVFMFLAMFFVYHVPFIMGLPWSPGLEMAFIALFFAWTPLWDYYWFVLNPAYKGKFKKNQIWWHATKPWIAGLFPSGYAVSVLISLAFAEGAALAHGSQALFIGHLKLLGGFAIATVALHVLVAPAYQRWYHRMRQRDDRDKAPIFHKDAA